MVCCCISGKKNLVQSSGDNPENKKNGPDKNGKVKGYLYYFFFLEGRGEMTTVEMWKKLFCE